MSGCARRSLLLATAICLSWSGCRRDKENDVPPVPMDMAPMDRPPRATSFDYSGGLISPGSTQQDLIGIKETMLRKALMTGKERPDEDGFPNVTSLKPSSPVFVETDLDLHSDSQISVPGWTIQVVSESTARTRGGGNRYFSFGLIQIFGDLALGDLTLGHPDLPEGSGGGTMWLVRTGGIGRFYKYEFQWVS